MVIGFSPIDKNIFLMTITDMTKPQTPDELETVIAEVMLAYMRNFIETSCKGDIEARIAGLSARCLELATPGLSERNRAAIFWSEQ